VEKSTKHPPRLKRVTWYEYSCPDCDATNTLDVPPFPVTHTCRECGRSWSVPKLQAAGYVFIASDDVPV